MVSTYVVTFWTNESSQTKSTVYLVHLGEQNWSTGNAYELLRSARSLMKLIMELFGVLLRLLFAFKGFYFIY